MRVLLKNCFSAFFLFLLTLPIFALNRVVSPVEGKWANRQSLVLNINDGAECFYSYSGTDPLTSGFAYDGPVLIDAAGDVTVRIVCVKGSSREEYQISYTVTSPEQNLFEEGSLEQNFINTISENPLYPFESNQRLTIPSSLRYSLGDGEAGTGGEAEEGVVLGGTVLSLSPDNSLSRYIPCIVSNGAEKWRFVIFIAGAEAGLFAKKDVPFSIKNWNEFEWKGEKLIYQIDDGMWSGDKTPRFLDRSVPHVIAWQSVSYSAGNPVQRFTLPARPVLEVRSKETGRDPVTFSLGGDASYRMEVVSSGAAGDFPLSNGLYYQITFDTFTGDAIGGEAVFAVYCDGVYQGELSAPYRIDKKPPREPRIVSSAKSMYARKPVSVSFEKGENETVFYAVSEPLVVTKNKTPQELKDASRLTSFKKYADSPLVLESKDSTAVYFMVQAYAVDDVGNKGLTSEYGVIIDEFDYYLVSPEKGGEESLGEADGSLLHPFTTISQALEAINGGKYAHFYVSGTFEFPAGESVILSNCTFEVLDQKNDESGDGIESGTGTETGDASPSSATARFIFPCDASLVVRSASVMAEGCIFEKTLSEESAKSSPSFFKLENAVLNLSDCEVVAVFDTTGTVFSSSSSVVDFQNTGVTVQSASYACGVSASDSKITAKKSRFTAIAKTAVDFSVTGGLFELRDSSCSVISHLGRIAELTKTNARYTGNEFKGELDSASRKVSALWKDEESLILEDGGNEVTGF